MASTLAVGIGDPTKLTDYQVLLRGHMSLSMTNMDSTSEPTFTGTVEVNGTLVTLAADSGTGWSGLGTSSDVWAYVQSTGTIVYSATVPSWDADKGGWYNGNDRAVAWMRKDSGDAYRYKHFLENKQSSWIIFTEYVEIGSWNLDATTQKSVAHELANATSIISLNLLIYPDTDSGFEDDVVSYWDQDFNGFTSGAHNIGADQTEINILRGVNHGLYDSVQFDDTGYNRGYIEMKHRAL